MKDQELRQRINYLVEHGGVSTPNVIRASEKGQARIMWVLAGMAFLQVIELLHDFWH